MVRIFFFLTWFALDIALFWFSRSGLAQYIFTLLLIPILSGVLLALLEKRIIGMSIRFQTLLFILMLEKLALFHWYVVPYVYEWNNPDGWLMEIGHHVIAFVIQGGASWLMLSLLRAKFSQRGKATRKEGSRLHISS